MGRHCHPQPFQRSIPILDIRMSSRALHLLVSSQKSSSMELAILKYLWTCHFLRTITWILHSWEIKRVGWKLTDQVPFVLQVAWILIKVFWNPLAHYLVYNMLIMTQYFVERLQPLLCYLPEKIALRILQWNVFRLALSLQRSHNHYRQGNRRGKLWLSNSLCLL